MAQYMLVLHDDPNQFSDLSPEEMQGVIQRYGAWAGKLAQEGRLAGGEKLTDDAGRILRRSGDKTTVKDGPFSETKEVFGGYFLINAENYDDAVEICQDCPHLDYGTIELRGVESTAS